MANSLKGRIWTLDTTGAITTDPCKVKKIRWNADGATAGADALISDPVTSAALYNATVPGSGTVLHSESELVENWWPRGFTLTTLGFGTLYVELE